jgi:hypothetical protein
VTVHVGRGGGGVGLVQTIEERNQLFARALGTQSEGDCTEPADGIEAQEHIVVL